MKMFPPEDTNVFNVILRNQGKVYGGYIRDFIAGVTPTDIDAVIPEINQGSFDHDMRKIGYTERIFNNENETWTERC